MRRYKKLTAVDYIPEMIAYFNADESRSFGDVGVKFGVTGQRIQQLLKGRVTPRRSLGNKGRPTGRTALAVRATLALTLSPMHNAKKMITMRAERLARLAKDPAVLLYRAERARHDQPGAALLAEAKKLFRRAERAASLAATHREDGTRRERRPKNRKTA